MSTADADILSPPAPPAPPAVPLEETPEFQLAVERAVAARAAASESAIVDAVLARMRLTMATSEPSATPGGSDEVFSKLAVAIADMADPQGGKNRIAPAILASMKASTERMGQLLLKAQALPANKRPRYRLVAKVYIKEQLVEPYFLRDQKKVATEILFAGPPNEAMRPVNALAREIFKEFIGSIGGSGAAMGVHSQPLWVTPQGAVLTHAPSATAQARGAVIEAEALVLDDDDVPAVGDGTVFDDGFAITNQNDPNLTEIAVLGTVHNKARVTAPGEKMIA